MIIKKLEMKGFGKFAAKEISLVEGLNVVYGPNESGKSTIIAFIIAMLFDMDREKDFYREIIVDRFFSWDSEVTPSGAIEFENNHILYRIEKNFSKKGNNTSLFNLSENKEIVPAAAAIADMFTGLDFNDYINTYFNSENSGAPNKSIVKSIQKHTAKSSSKLNHMVDTSYAVSILESRKRNFVDENAGRRIKELNRIIESEEETERRLDMIAEKEQAGLAEIEELQKRAEELLVPTFFEKHEQAYYRHKERYQVYKEDIASQREVSDALEEVIISRERLDENAIKLERCREELAEVRNFNRRNHVELARAKQEMESAGKIVLSESRSTLYKQASIAIFTFVLLIIALFCVFEEAILPAVIFFLTTFAGVVIFIIISTNAVKIKKQEKEHLDKITSEVKNLQDDKKIFDRSHSSEEELMERLETYLKEDGRRADIDAQEKSLSKKLAELESELAVRYDELLKFFVKFGGVEDLKDDELFIQENHLKEEAAARKKELEEVNKKIAAINESMIKMRTQIEAGDENETSLVSHREEREKLLEKAAETDREAKAVDMAINMIYELSKNENESVGKIVNQKASDYVAAFTNNQYTSFITDDKLNSRVDHLDKYVSTDKLSNGTISQMNLALKLSAGDIILSDYDMPLVFDDAFAYYDNERLAAVLRKICRRRDSQVLIFTCQNREETILSQLDVDYNYINIAEKNK